MKEEGVRQVDAGASDVISNKVLAPASNRQLFDTL